MTSEMDRKAGNGPEPELTLEEVEEALRKLVAAVAPPTPARPAGHAAPALAADRPAPLSRSANGDRPQDLPGDHFRGLLEAIPDALVIIDQQGVIVLVNTQTERLFGYKREELLGRPIEVLIPERFRAGHVAQRDAYLRDPRVRPMGQNIELTGRRKDGQEVPVEISLSPMQAEDGLLVIATVRDISERRRDREQLRQAEMRYRTIVEEIPAVTFMAPLDQDQGTPELYVSPQIEQLLGFSQQEWLDNPFLWYRQLHPEDKTQWSTGFAPTCLSGQPYQGIYRFLAKDGRVVWVHGSARVVRNAAGEPALLQGIAFDITAVKEAEEERDRFFTLAIDLFSIMGFDRYHKIVNPAFTRTLGFTAEELLRRPYLDFVHPDDRDATLEVFQRLVEGGETLSFENRCVCRDGSYRWLQWSAAAYHPRRVIYAAARDITRQKQDEEELRQLNAELERRVQERTAELARSNAELDDFAYVASHDLKEPLRTMRSYTGMLVKKLAGQLEASSTGFTERIINGGLAMERLIDDLYYYSRAGREGEPEALDANRLLEQARENLHESIRENQGEVTADPLPFVKGVETHLVRLFQNLIGNAVKFRAPRRPVRVHVSAGRHGADWLFSVRDNGIGMAPRDVARLFTKIGQEARLHARSKYPGTGFGLAICRKIVERHGGRISVESQLDVGTTFSFTLPDTAAAANGDGRP